MSAWVALAISAVLLLVNGFFVALEFSLVGSRRTKLEELATSNRTLIDVTLETRGKDQIQRILEALAEAGYRHERVL